MRSTSILSLALLGLSVITGCGTGTSSGTSGTSGTSGSSSTGAQLGGVDKAKTCKNISLNHASDTASACSDCEATKCSAEGAALIGTDPAAFGGACGGTITCSCECDNADKACLAKCPLPSQACKDAITAAQGCEATKCAVECNKDAG